MAYLFQNVIKKIFFVLFLTSVAGNFFYAQAKVVVIDKSPENEYPFDVLKVNVWQELEEGVSFVRIAQTILVDREEENNQKLPVTVNFDVLKFEAGRFDFSVYGAVTDNTESKPLLSWLKDFGLKAVINASMYLPDNKTSIGYLKKGNIYNNRHIGKKLGAFFVSEPYEEFRGKIPDCAIFYMQDAQLDEFFSPSEKERSIKKLLEKYRVAVQNFRIYDPENSGIRWKGQRRHTIAAVAQDKENNILLMYASKELTVQEFRTILQKNPLLRIKRAMYAEGGTEASMAYGTDPVFLWQHQDNIMLFLKGVVRLPNVIGIKKR